MSFDLDGLPVVFGFLRRLCCFGLFVGLISLTLCVLFILVFRLAIFVCCLKCFCLFNWLRCFVWFVLW